MPISPIVLQRRHAELGRIRLGAKRNGNGAPMKLEAFRFTSPSEQYIRDLAALYGGQARQWDNNGKPEWEVHTEATSIPVIVVKGGLSQWMETWSGGGIAHRCDGERTVDGGLCENDDTTVTIKGKTFRAHDLAKPTTRLSVMLPELEAVGVFRMETHGWNAAAEIPAVAELAQFVGDLVPAVLYLVERRQVKDGKTSRFVVPVLDLQIGRERLKQIVAATSGAVAEVEAQHAQRAAIEAGPAARDWLAEAKAATTLDEWRAVWNEAANSPDWTPQMKAEFTNIGKRIADNTSGSGGGETGSVEQAPPGGPPDPAHTDADPDAIWMQILAAAGAKTPPMTTPEVEDAFAQFAGGVTAATASAAELQAYLTHLKEA